MSDLKIRFRALVGLSLAGLLIVMFLGSGVTSRTGNNRNRVQELNGAGANPRERERFEWLRTHDPVTGRIPERIRSKELAFAAGLPTSDRLQLHAAGPGNNTDRIQTTVWSGRGPFNIGGRTRALAVDVASTNVVLAGGVSGGMWRSVDGGSSWIRTTSSDQLHSVTCVAQDTRTGHAGTWYYGTGEYLGNSADGGGGAFYQGDGLFKSTDDGQSWSVLGSTSSGKPESFSSVFDYVWDIALDPSVTSSDVVYAAVYGTVARSTDGGATWSGVVGGSSPWSSRTCVQVTGTGIAYAAGSSEGTAAGIWRSPDGVTWTSITPAGFPSAYGRIVIGNAPSDDSVVYFVVEGTNGTDGVDQINSHQFWKYTDAPGGGTWENRGVNLPNQGGLTGNAVFDTQQGYDMLLRVKPDDPNFVVVGSTNLYRSTDGFATGSHWQRIGGYKDTSTYAWYPNSHPDQHSGTFVPGSSIAFLSGHDGGLSRTADVTAGTVSWSSMNNGYYTTQFYSIALDHATSGSPDLVGGLQDVGSWFTNSSSTTASWLKEFGGDGTTCAIADGRTSYYLSSQNGTAYRLLLDANGALTDYARVDPTGGSGYLFVVPFRLDPADNGIMYLASGGELWRNSDLTGVPLASTSPGTANNTTSVNWTDLTSASVSGTNISALGASTASPPHRLYYGTADGIVYRLDNAHTATATATPTTISTGAGFPAGAYVSGIAVDPTNGDDALLVFSNYSVISAYYTSDAGASWGAVAGNLEQNADGSGSGPSLRWAAILPYSGTTYYYVGTSTGLYSTTALNGGSTVWALEGGSTIGNVVVDAIDVRSSDGMVAVGTHGNGSFSGVASPNGVAERTVPLSTSLEQNFPNPFNPSTTVRFSLAGNAIVTLKVYDVAGREVSTLAKGRMSPGEHSVVWTPANLSSGVYFCRITAYFLSTGSGSSYEHSLKMLYVR